MWRWNHLMFKTKIFITVWAVLLLMISLTCLIFYYKNVNDTKDQAHALLNTLSRQYSTTLELYMQDIEKMSLSIFTDPMIQNSLIDHNESADPAGELYIRNVLFARLFNHAHPRPDVTSIEIFTPDQKLYNYSKGYNLQVNMSGRSEEWQKDLDHIPKSEYLLLPTKERTAMDGRSEKVLSLVRNIYRIPKRDKIGVMKIGIQAKALGSLLASSNQNEIEKQMRVFIITDNGNVIYDSHDRWTGKKNVSLAPAVFAAKSRAGDLTWEGTRYLYTFEKSDYTGWNAMILLPQDFIVSKQKEIQNILIVIGLIATLLAALLAYVMSHQITAPLRIMMKKMNRVEIGVFNERMEFTGRNEIGVLSRVYNNMLDSISRLIHEVYDSKLAEKNAKLSALQAQINPHFLYNTLNIMKSISRLKGVEEVAEMSESLAELFKYSMNNVQHPVPLRDEMEHIDHYTNIQKHRFGDRFQLCADIPENLMDALVLKLTIQPLVENAMIHGLARTKSGGRIDIIARHADGVLKISVSDNGIGIDEAALSKLVKTLQTPNRIQTLAEDAYGIGLKNIHQRIQLLYGENYGVKINSALGKGTTVTLEFPT